MHTKEPTPHHQHHGFFDPLPPIAHHGHPTLYFVKLIATVVVGLLILFAIALIPNKYRKVSIALVTFLAGLYYVLEFFIPVNPVVIAMTIGHFRIHHVFTFFLAANREPDNNFLTPFQTPVANVSNVIGALSVGLGIISLIGMHLRTVSRVKQGWGFSLTLLISFVAMFSFHLLNEYDPRAVLFRQHRGWHATVTNSDFYQFLFKGGLVSLDSAMFALIGFFIVSSSYRAFRIRSVESSLLMGSALIVMLGQVSVGIALTNWLPAHGEAANFRFEVMAQNILQYVNSPAQRAITFGLALGFLATSLRLWLSLERGLYFD